MERDFVRLNMAVGPKMVSCDLLGFDWPPPEYILLDAKAKLVGLTVSEFTVLDVEEKPYVFQRESYSQISDADITEMDHVVRGAEYRYVENNDE